MTVSELEKKYSEIQGESIELQKQLKPLLKRLKTLAKKSQKLGYRIDNDKNLYTKEFGSFVAKDWDDGIMFRLNDFDCVEDAIESIDTVLYNINHTKFWRKGHKGKMVKVSLPTGRTSVGTIEFPDDVIQGFPPMDM
jgi:hypothetical protein